MALVKLDKPVVYPATVTDVHDGDTFYADIDLGTGRLLGFALWAHGLRVRLAACNAAELDQPGGPEARDNLAKILTPGTVVTLHITAVDKYRGRVDAMVTTHDDVRGDRDLVADLILAGWLAAWDGRLPKPVPPWPRPQAAAQHH